MPHQCTKCSKIYPDASKELLEGCSCGSRFFYYIRQEKLDELKSETKKVMEELEKADKEQIEKDIRELTGLDKKPDEPVILDLESIRVLKPGKFEIDIVNLFNKNRPLIYKLGEGKYIIDLVSSLSVDKKKTDKKIRGSFEEFEKELEEEFEEDENDIDEENEDKSENEENEYENEDNEEESEEEQDLEEEENDDEELEDGTSELEDEEDKIESKEKEESEENDEEIEENIDVEIEKDEFEGKEKEKLD